MSPFTARFTRWKLLLLLAGALAFVLAGVWIAGLLGGDASITRIIIGWISILFFGGCGVIIARRLFDQDDQLMISARGIYIKQWSQDTVPWSEITDVTTWSMQGQTSIILHLRDPARFPSTGLLGKIAAVNRAMTGGDIPIQLTGMNRSVEEALAAIRHFGSANASR